MRAEKESGGNDQSESTNHTLGVTTITGRASSQYSQHSQRKQKLTVF